MRARHVAVMTLAGALPHFARGSHLARPSLLLRSEIRGISALEAQSVPLYLPAFGFRHAICALFTGITCTRRVV
jgi:hypothetical protein